jgi:tetratricopeptide (TPR) repeat protein
MHRTAFLLVAGKRGALLLAALGLMLWSGLFSVAAQETAPLSAPPQSDSAKSDDLPLLVIVLQRPAEASPRRDDPNLSLRTALANMLRASGRFRVLVYSPSYPTVRRALLSHELTVSELVEPIQQDALQHLGRTLDARYVLSFAATLDKEALHTDVLLQESFSPREWRTLFMEQMRIATISDRNHLKRDDLINLTVDTIASRMGIPSNQAAGLRLRGMPKPKPTRDAQKSSKGEKTDASTTTPAGTSDGTSRDIPEGTETQPTPGKNANGSGTSVGTTPTQPTPDTQAREEGTGKREETASPTPNAQRLTPPPGAPQNLPDFGGLNAPNQPDLSTPPAPPTNQTHIDYESLSNQFQQQGDLANLITALRHAINDHPRDMTLRYRLIQAYQDRQLADAAMTETNRALQLSPGDAGLHRLYGDCLLAKGDTAGALKAYHEAAQMDPADILTQVALGDALLADNQYAEAMSAYQAAAKNDPKSPLPHRRMARALARSAAADPTQYAASLEQVQAARALIPSTDTETYQEDYSALMHLMAGRLSDLLDELQATYQAALTGKRAEDLTRAAADMRRRAEAAEDYLDKLPPAAGQDVTHAHYQQAAAFLLQALSLFRDYVTKHDSSAEETLKADSADARSELSIANKRLDAARAAHAAGKPAAPGETGGL